MLEKYKNFCPVPWTQFATSTIGEQRMCCVMDFETTDVPSHGKFIYTNGKKLTVKNSVLEYINSDSVKLIKEDLINNRQPHTCMCYQNEIIIQPNDDHISKRQSYLNKFNLNTDNDVEEFLKQDHKIDYFDIRLGNQCNLQCLMCTSSLSNQLYDQDLFKSTVNDIQLNDSFTIRKENNKIIFDAKQEKELFDWADENFFNDLEKVISDQLSNNPNQIITFYFLGGEPLLNQPHFNFLNNMYKKGLHKSIALEYNTNLTVNNNEILELWSNFEKCTLALSIDDTEDRYEYIRYPAKWSKILNNLTELKHHMSKTPNVYRTVNIVSVINAFTLDNFTNVENLAKQFNIGSAKIISWGPNYTTPSILTLEEKKEYLNYIPKDNNYSDLETYLFSFGFDNSARKDFFRLLEFWNSRRRKPFKEVFTNLAKVLKL